MSLKKSEKTDVNTQVLEISITPEQLDEACERVFRRNKKSIQIPGFRKGKVTRKLAERYFGEGAFYEEALNLLMNQEIPAAVAAENLTLVDRPQAEVVSIDKENGAELKVLCVLMPEVQVPEYKGIKARKEVKEITDAEIESQLQVIRSRNARIVTVDDRPAQNGDEVTIDFKGLLDGEAFEGGSAENFPLTLGSGQFIPGFEDQVVGHSAEEEFDIQVTFPEDYQMSDLAGKEVTFQIKIHTISAQEMPELDDEFVKDATEFDTVDELREDIRKKLSDSAASAADSAFENAVYTYLIENMEAVIPPVMFERRIDALVNNFEESLKQQQMTLEVYLQYTGMDIGSFRDTFEDRAKNEVKLRLALNKIAELEGIIPTEDEINEGLQQFVAQTGLSLEEVKRRIPMEDYLEDLRVSKAATLVREAAVVDNTLPESEESAEETEETAE